MTLREYLFIYTPKNWPLNLNIQHGALAFLPGRGWLEGRVLELLSMAVRPWDHRWDAPEPAAANSSKR
jgi:hypothetical protein